MTDSISLARALQLGPLREARVVAGSAGIERPIRHVNVMEVPDILPWVQPDELLLTTAYPLRDERARLETLVPELAARGLAGIAIKPDRYLGRIPESMITAAEATGFPLIELPPASSFNEIISAVLSLILNEQSLRLERAARIHDRLTDIVLGGGGMREIAVTVAELVGRPVAIVDQQGVTLTDSAGLADRSVAAALVSAPISGEDGRAVPIDAGGRPATLQPILVDGVPYGGLVVLALLDDLSDDDREALRFAATVAALRQVQARAVVEDDRRFRAVWLEELTGGHVTQRSVLAERAAAFGWDLAVPRAVLLAQPDGASSDPAVVRTLAEAARQSLGSRVIVWERGSQVAALMPAGRADTAGLTDAAGLLQREAGRRLPGLTISIGIGRLRADPLELPDSHAEARQALEVARWRHPGEVVAFEEMGLDRLLAGSSEAELTAYGEAMIGPLLAHDRQHGAMLVDTLEAYLATRNVAATARRLYVHYNTVRSRLARVEELVGPLLANAERLTAVAVALHLHRRGRLAGSVAVPGAILAQSL
jgi:purine catabolism regulator